MPSASSRTAAPVTSPDAGAASPMPRYYELRIDPVPDAPLTIQERITLTSTRTRIALPHVAPGSLLTLCVRAVGAKGTGPFCDPLTVRVN